MSPGSDTGIGFTVILRPTREQASPRPSLNRAKLRVYDALAARPEDYRRAPPGPARLPACQYEEGAAFAPFPWPCPAARRPRSSHLVRAHERQ